jgi:hypothetical protein
VFNDTAPSLELELINIPLFSSPTRKLSRSFGCRQHAKRIPAHKFIPHKLIYKFSNLLLFFT